MVTPFQGMWISAVILFPLGIFLTYKAATDAAIMNMDTYSNFIRKINRFFRYYLIKLRPS
jgi:lipopolysaccharide export system permease protein